MRIYLVQHGEPVSKEINPDRPLSEKGRGDVEKAARFLARLKVSVDKVYHSGKTRAEQTAQILAPAIRTSGAAEFHQGLSPLDPVEPIAEELSKIDKDVLVAGHLPFLNKLAGFLLACSEDTDVIAFRQGGIVCLERDENNIWRVCWMVTPDIAGSK